MNTPRKVLTGLAAVAGLAALTFGGSTTPPAQAAPLPPGLARPHRGDGDRDRDDRRPRAERHPEIQAALLNLRQAKSNLQRASHDFAGHREQALDLTQRAIEQCEQALQADKK